MTDPNPAFAETPRDFVGSFAKGLSVIKAFSGANTPMTLSEIAAATKLSRAGARRLLLTLTELGYARLDGRQFSLTPRILELGFPYLASNDWIDQATPVMKSLTARLHESCSAAVLDGSDIVYVARIPAQRIMSVTLNIGTRLPALFTSMGRVQLGVLGEDGLRDLIAASPLTALTEKTLVDPRPLFDRICEDIAQGHSIVDQELELGLISLAVPLLHRDGGVRAAINIASHISRMPPEKLTADVLPVLKDAVLELSDALY